MTIRTPRAKQLTTQAELSLYESSLSRNAAGLSAAKLRSHVTRARKARDKYTQLAARQSREARGKAEPRRARRSQGNAQTLEKALLFQEVLDRLEARLDVVAAQEAKAAAAKPAKTTRAPGRKTKVKTGAKKAKAKPAAKKKAAKTKPAAKKKAPAKKKSAASTGLSGWKTVRGGGRKAKTTPKRKAKTRVSKTPSKTAAAAKRQRVVRSGATRTQKHVSARGRRTQAKRDAKR